MLAEADLKQLGLSERQEQLEVMLLEAWDDDPSWQSLPRSVREEMATEQLRDDASSSRYDPVLLIWLRTTFVGATTEYLKSRLNAIGVTVDSVEGEPERLEACPCCGYRTLNERGEYSICTICWWEDDGQDNSRADTTLGGPNGDLSLTQARWNFLVYGISDPRRTDLQPLQAPKQKFPKGRVFRLLRADHTVVEDAQGWSGRVQGE